MADFRRDRAANKEWADLSIGSPGRPQKPFNDFGYLVALREVEAEKLDVGTR